MGYAASIEACPTPRPLEPSDFVRTPRPRVAATSPLSLVWTRAGDRLMSCNTVVLASASLVGVATLVLAGGSASAQSTCDFLTGGGFIIRPSGAKANFGIAGGCKGGSPTWGHLEYTDRGEGLQVQWTRITAYFFDSVGAGMDHQPTGTRFVCGTARTNRTSGYVDWVVRAMDSGEPGTDDVFSIQLSQFNTIIYSTFPEGSGRRGGGNVQLHKPNPSTSGSFSTDPATCPAAFAE